MEHAWLVADIHILFSHMGIKIPNGSPAGLCSPTWVLKYPMGVQQDFVKKKDQKKNHNFHDFSWYGESFRMKHNVEGWHRDGNHFDVNIFSNGKVFTKLGPKEKISKK
jgi:hypothetical protein